MADASIDVLMRIVGKAGAFPGESATQFLVGPDVDKLRQDFQPGLFCELREFSFSAGVASSLAKKPDDRAAKPAGLTVTAPAAPPLPLTELERRAQRAQAGAQKWMAIRDSQNAKLDQRNRSEFVDMQPVEFTRIMDSSSTLLFQALVGCETLETISVVKRKATGSANSGECYLRLDFNKVLVTDLSWKDSEHLIMETGEFIYRNMTIRYRPQNPDGSLGAVIQSSWAMGTAPVR